MISREKKDGLITFISSNYNINLIEEDFISDKTNKIYDTIYMLPFIIHNTIFQRNSLNFEPMMF